MTYQPASLNPFYTIHQTLINTSPSQKSSKKPSIDKSLILAYEDPTCNNIFLYNIGSHHFLDENNEIRPEFVGVSSSQHPYYYSTSHYSPPLYGNNGHTNSYVPVLKSIQSSHGLLCIVTRRPLLHGSVRSEYHVRIINPVTSQSIELPPARPDRFRPWVGFGIGLEPNTDEPMVVRLCHSHSFHYQNNNKHPECRPYHPNSGTCVNVVETLSLRDVNSNGWKSVLIDCHSIPWATTLKPVSLRGALHWMVHNLPKPEPILDHTYHRFHTHGHHSDSDNEGYSRDTTTIRIDYSSLLIARFDLVNPELKKYPGPPVTGGSGGYDPSGIGPGLMELRGCLSLVVDMGYSMDIWMMKEYGKEESWAKHVSIPLDFSSSPPHVLSVLGDGEVLMLRSDQLLELYDPKTRSYKIFRVSTVTQLEYIAVIQPSLTSPVY